MRTIIAGSRTVVNYNILLDALSFPEIWPITTVISGTARGADKLGEIYADQKNIPLEQFPADWATHGRRAGYLRNVQMAENAEACIVLWDGKSRGAKMMIGIAKKKGLRLLVWSTGLGYWTFDQFSPGKAA